MPSHFGDYIFAFHHMDANDMAKGSLSDLLTSKIINDPNYITIIIESSVLGYPYHHNNGIDKFADLETVSNLLDLIRDIIMNSQRCFRLILSSLVPLLDHNSMPSIPIAFYSAHHLTPFVTYEHNLHQTLNKALTYTDKSYIFKSFNHNDMSLAYRNDALSKPRHYPLHHLEQIGDYINITPTDFRDRTTPSGNKDISWLYRSAEKANRHSIFNPTGKYGMHSGTINHIWNNASPSLPLLYQQAIQYTTQIMEDMSSRISPSGILYSLGITGSRLEEFKGLLNQPLQPEGYLIYSDLVTDLSEMEITLRSRNIAYGIIRLPLSHYRQTMYVRMIPHFMPKLGSNFVVVVNARFTPEAALRMTPMITSMFNCRPFSINFCHDSPVLNGFTCAKIGSLNKYVNQFANLTSMDTCYGPDEYFYYKIPDFVSVQWTYNLESKVFTDWHFVEEKLVGRKFHEHHKKISFYWYQGDHSKSIIEFDLTGPSIKQILIDDVPVYTPNQIYEPENYGDLADCQSISIPIQDHATISEYYQYIGPLNKQLPTKSIGRDGKIHGLLPSDLLVEAFTYPLANFISYLHELGERCRGSTFGVYALDVGIIDRPLLDWEENHLVLSTKPYPSSDNYVFPTYSGRHMACMRVIAMMILTEYDIKCYIRSGRPGIHVLAIEKKQRENQMADATLMDNEDYGCVSYSLWGHPGPFLDGAIFSSCNRSNLPYIQQCFHDYGHLYGPDESIAALYWPETYTYYTENNLVYTGSNITGLKEKFRKKEVLDFSFDRAGYRVTAQMINETALSGSLYTILASKILGTKHTRDDDPYHDTEKYLMPTNNETPLQTTKRIVNCRNIGITINTIIFWIIGFLVMLTPLISATFKSDDIITNKSSIDSKSPTTINPLVHNYNITNIHSLSHENPNNNEQSNSYNILAILSIFLNLPWYTVLKVLIHRLGENYYALLFIFLPITVLLKPLFGVRIKMDRIDFDCSTIDINIDKPINDNEVVFCCPGSHGDRIPYYYLARFLKKHGVDVSVQTGINLTTKQLESISSGNVLWWIPQVIHAVFPPFRNHIYNPFLSSFNQTRISVANPPSLLKNNKIFTVLQRKVTSIFQVGNLEGCNLLRSANGFTPLPFNQDHNGKTETAVAMGSTKESIPSLGVQLTNYDPMEFMKYGTIYTHGGSGTSQTALAYGANVISLRKDLDRDIGSLSPSDTIDPSHGMYALLSHACLVSGKPQGLNTFLKGLPVTAKTFFLMRLLKILKALILCYILSGLALKLFPIILAILSTLITISPYTNILFRPKPDIILFLYYWPIVLVPFMWIWYQILFGLVCFCFYRCSKQFIADAYTIQKAVIEWKFEWAITFERIADQPSWFTIPVHTGIMHLPTLSHWEGQFTSTEINPFNRNFIFKKSDNPITPERFKFVLPFFPKFNSDNPIPLDSKEKKYSLNHSCHTTTLDVIDHTVIPKLTIWVFILVGMNAMLIATIVKWWQNRSEGFRFPIEFDKSITFGKPDESKNKDDGMGDNPESKDEQPSLTYCCRRLTCNCLEQLKKIQNIRAQENIDTQPISLDEIRSLLISSWDMYYKIVGDEIWEQLSDDDINHVNMMTLHDHLKQYHQDEEPTDYFKILNQHRPWTSKQDKLYDATYKNWIPKSDESRPDRSPAAIAYDFIYKTLIPYRTGGWLNEIIIWLEQRGFKILAYAHNVLAFLARFAALALNHSAPVYYKILDFVDWYVDEVFQEEYRQRIKSVWAATTLVKTLNSSEKMRLEEIIAYSNPSKRTTAPEDYQKFCDHVEKGMNLDADLFVRAQRNIKWKNPVMSNNEAQMLGITDYVNPEWYEQRMNAIVDSGVKQGADMVYFTELNTERIANGVDRYGTKYDPVSTGDRIMAWRVMKAMHDSDPKLYGGWELTRPEITKFNVLDNNKLPYSAGLPFLSQFKKRADIEKLGLSTFLNTSTREILASGVYPIQWFQAFTKSQIVDANKTINEGKNARLIVAQDIMSSWIDHVFLLQRNKRIAPEVSGVGLKLNQYMGQIFEKLDKKAQEKFLLIEGDCSQFDAYTGPFQYACAYPRAFFGFKHKGLDKATRFASWCSAKSHMLEESYVVSITSHPANGITVVLPNENKKTLEKLIALYPSKFLDFQSVRSPSYNPDDPIYHGKILLTTDQTVYSSMRVWPGKPTITKEWKHLATDYPHFGFIHQLNNLTKLQRSQKPIYSQIPIDEHLLKLHDNLDVIMNFHPKNRGGGTGMSDTSVYNTDMFKASMIAAWCRYHDYTKSPDQFYGENFVHNTGDDNCWAVKLSKKDYDPDKMAECFRHYSLRLESKVINDIEDIQYLGNKVMRSYKAPFCDDWSLYQQLSSDNYKRSTGITKTTPPRPRLLVYKDLDQVQLRRTALRYYQSSTRKYVHTLLNGAMGRALLTQWNRDFYDTLATEFVTDLHTLARSFRVKGQVAEVRPIMLNKEPTVFNEVKIFLPPKAVIAQMNPQAQEFWNIARTLKFPSYYNVLRIQLNIDLNDTNKYEKFLAKFKKGKIYDEPIRELFDMVISPITSLPRKLYKMIPNLNTLYPEPNWYTRKYYICKAIDLQYARDGAPIQTLGQMQSALMTSPAGAIMDGQAYMHNRDMGMYDKEFEEKAPNGDPAFYKAACLLYTFYYTLFYYFETLIIQVPLIGLAWRVLIFLLIDITKGYSVLNLAYWHENMRSSPIISSMMPRDPYRWLKAFAYFMVEATPDIVIHAVTIVVPLLPYIARLSETLANFFRHQMQIKEIDSDHKDFVNPWNYVQDPDNDFYKAFHDYSKQTVVTAETGTGKSTLLIPAMMTSLPSIPFLLPTHRRLTDHDHSAQIIHCMPDNLNRENFGSPKMWDIEKPWTQTLAKTITFQRLKRDVNRIPEAQLLVMTYGHAITRLHEFSQQRPISDYLFIFDEFHLEKPDMLVLFEELIAFTPRPKFLFLSATVTMSSLNDVNLHQSPIMKRFWKNVYYRDDSSSTVNNLEWASSEFPDKVSPERAGQIIIKETTFPEVASVMDSLYTMKYPAQEVSSRTIHRPIDPTQVIVSTDVISTGLNLPGRSVLITNGERIASIKGQTIREPSDKATEIQTEGRIGRFQNGDLYIAPIKAGSGKKNLEYGNIAMYRHKRLARHHKLPWVIPYSQESKPKNSIILERSNKDYQINHLAFDFTNLPISKSEENAAALYVAMEILLDDPKKYYAAMKLFIEKDAAPEHLHKLVGIAKEFKMNRHLSPSNLKIWLDSASVLHVNVDPKDKLKTRANPTQPLRPIHERFDWYSSINSRRRVNTVDGEHIKIMNPHPNSNPTFIITNDELVVRDIVCPVCWQMNVLRTKTCVHNRKVHDNCIRVPSGHENVKSIHYIPDTVSLLKDYENRKAEKMWCQINTWLVTRLIDRQQLTDAIKILVEENDLSCSPDYYKIGLDARLEKISKRQYKIIKGGRRVNEIALPATELPHLIA